MKGTAPSSLDARRHFGADQLGFERTDRADKKAAAHNEH